MGALGAVRSLSWALLSWACLFCFLAITSAAPKDILSSDFVEIHAPAQGEGIRGKGARSELPPLGQGKGMRFSPWAREKDQGEGAGRGNHIPLPDPFPWPREGSHSFPLAQGMSFRPSPWGRERNVDPPPGQGQVFTILPCPQGVDVNLLPAPREEELKTSPCPQGVGFGGRERVQGIQGEAAARAASKLGAP